MFFHQTSLEGLGCFSYMIGSHETHECAIVDPQRDIADYLEIAADNGLTITYVIETHVHADHVSGSQELAAQTGATICIHQLERRAHEVEQCRPVVAYCRGGTRSQTAASILAQLGYRVVYNMVGGIESWRRAGYPVTRN